MAAGFTFVCKKCRYEIRIWDEGNPFILDDQGEKHFYYHPGGDRVIEQVVQASAVGRDLTGEQLAQFIESRIGNMSVYVCLDCGEEYEVEWRPNSPETAPCPKCHSANTCPAIELDGRPCPKCRKGVIRADPKQMLVS